MIVRRGTLSIGAGAAWLTACRVWCPAHIVQRRVTEHLSKTLPKTEDGKLSVLKSVRVSFVTFIFSFECMQRLYNVVTH